MLELITLEDPIPGKNEIRLKVTACGVCHTKSDEIEGRTPPPTLPVILGHQVVGRVDKKRAGVLRFDMGDRTGW